MPLTAAEIEALALKAQSVSTDAGSATQPSADDRLKLLAAAAAAAALDGANVNGGPRSPFNCLRPARAAFPGAHR